MTNNIRDLLRLRDGQIFATNAGTKMHARLKRIFIDDETATMDKELVGYISANPILRSFFTKDSLTEVPVAGFIDGKFISRRIDRMLINHDHKSVLIMDYKTDINPVLRRNGYKAQLDEYAKLLRKIYPDYTIRKFILWTHTWTSEEIS